MNAVITMITSICATIASSIVLLLVKMWLTRIQRESQKREQLKAQENILILRLLNALGKLTRANCIALRDGKTNGDLASALKEYENIEHEMYDYLLQTHNEKH